jgi:chitinase
MGSAVSAISAWTAAGMPAHKIALGVAAYGHSYRVDPGEAYVNGRGGELYGTPLFNAADQPVGDAWDDQPGTDVCGNEQGYGGSWNYWGLVDGGWISADGGRVQGISYRYDECSQTVCYVYSSVISLFTNSMGYHSHMSTTRHRRS